MNKFRKKITFLTFIIILIIKKIRMIKERLYSNFEILC